MKQLSLSHQKINDFLTILVVCFGLYLIGVPYLPQVGWWLHPPTPVASHTIKIDTAAALPPIPADNELVIPRLGMKETIHTGPTIAELRKGVWLIPGSSTPDQGSNTVIIGHRFTYAGPAVFYFLDKVQLGDSITVDWQHKEYTYTVKNIRAVLPTDVSVERPTKNSQLTLYTCTPLWSVSHRLVITATLTGVRS